jgi:hypothetical protein
MLNPDGRLWIDRLRRNRRYGERDVRCRWRAHRPAGRAPCRRRGPCPAARASRPSLPERASGSRGFCRRSSPHPAFAIRKPAVAVFTLDDYVAAGDHVGRQAEALRAASRPRQHPRRRRHLDRQDHAHQRAARRGREDLRPRRPDRGHARAAMRRAQPRRRCAPRMASRRSPISSARRCACAPTASHRRGARRRGARPPQSLGHRPSRRRRHDPCRQRRSARCAGWNSSSRKPSSPCRAR